MGYALIVVVVFLTGQGNTFATKAATLEACLSQLADIPAKIAEHNSKAAPPEYISMYASACAEIKSGPKGKDA